MNTIPERFKINTASFAHYWQHGVGKDLLQYLGYTPDLKDANQFTPLFFEVDVLGDALVNKYHIPLGFKKAQTLIDRFLDQPNQVSEEDKNYLESFINSIDPNPGWVDWKLLQKGIELSQRSSLPGLIVLRDYCLMGGYESAAINKPLIHTGSLKKGAAKRLTETVTFWVDITGDQALEYGKIGFKAAINTRMVHAYARHSIYKYVDWKDELWGAPLNMWDMLATNLGFSLVYLVGLRRMGMQPQEDEIAGLFHLWKYVGHLLGIPIHLLPTNEKEAIVALYHWTMTQADGDADSKTLALALQAEPIHAYYPPTKLGRKMMREIHLYYNRYLLGDYSCDILGLDHTLIGKIAYLNILKNKKEERKISDPNHRASLIQKGRKTHLGVKDIYVQFNNQQNNQ